MSRENKSMDRKEETKSYFQNIFQELKVEDRVGFKVMFHVSLTDYEFLLSKISDLIWPQMRESVETGLF